MLRMTRTAILTAVSLAAGLSGCADNDSSLFIEGVLAISNTDCVAQPDADAEFLANGLLDVLFARGYVAAVQVGNQLTQQGNREKLRTETSRVQLEGAKGTVFDVLGGEHEFEALATGFVHPASGTDPGVAAMFVNLVPADVIDQLADADAVFGQMAVRFKVYGTTLGGEEIESGDFTYPIAVCEGCLVDYPPDANVNMGGDYLCGNPSDTADDEPVCHYGQDQRFPCSACAASFDECTSPDMNPYYDR